MTTHSNSNGTEAIARHAGAQSLRLVGTSKIYDSAASANARQSLPRWAVYGLIAFYCVAAWSLAFWAVSALL
ncbi:MAG: hypothetical protein MRY64_03040 [Hyphomonadaceae bacterium]|nr:hypothetical protein [Hyphomonadaceae bacterium]